MRMKKMISLLALFLLTSAYCVQSTWAQENCSCVRCHTDELRIKSLYKPPKIEFKVEEGEG